MIEFGKKLNIMLSDADLAHLLDKDIFHKFVQLLRKLCKM